ncbi:hypothetical protein pqer_cds_18 [Pandoravirus quercus]|uniref:Uncharacterized protein n=1 Tax=Pandoravirus quercus TaxID=2107709 RepID=A0A2U7U7N8_9VIRU|nr:hypothetical protein pqer_cds_18 [Pandoravirus quercus]AVK74440.1 hypothetical protein pqer_cds_18 [Pandoravirus quercus]
MDLGAWAPPPRSPVDGMPRHCSLPRLSALVVVETRVCRRRRLGRPPLWWSSPSGCLRLEPHASFASSSLSTLSSSLPSTTLSRPPRRQRR